MAKKKKVDVGTSDSWLEAYNDNDKWGSSMMSHVSTKEKFGWFAKNRARVFSILIVISLVAITIFAASNIYNTIQTNQALSEYPPTFHTRYHDVGKLIVENYYTGMPLPVPINSTVQGANPGGYPDTDETSAEQLQGWSANASLNENVVTGIEQVGGGQLGMYMDSNDQVSNPEDFQSSHSEWISYHMYLNGQPMKVTIQLQAPSRQSDALPILLDDPSMEPWSVSDEEQSINNSPAQKSEAWVNASMNEDAVQDVVTAFADSWAANDQTSLRQITQDPEGRKYVGLGGWSLSSDPTILWAISSSSDSDTAFLRISFPMTQSVVASSDDDEDSSPSDNTQVHTMDLMVAKIKSQLPAVVSWGPAGSYQQLDEFSVGEDGDVNTMPEEEDSTTTTKSTPSTGSSTGDSGSSGSTRDDSLGGEPSDNEDSGDTNDGDEGSSGGSSGGALSSEECARMGFSC